MSNIIRYKDRIAFHPGYYIKELVDDSGLTQEDFAKRLDTTPKNLSLLIRGEQSLSLDLAMKLSRMLGTSTEYWLNLQTKFDTMVIEFKSDQELAQERETFRCLDYKYFMNNYGLPDLPRKTDQQIKEVREFLRVASLKVFQKEDMAVSFRSCSGEISEANTIKANVMVQIAINTALQVDAPRYNKAKFEKAIDYALTLTTDHSGFYPKIKQAFQDAGVIFVVLPNLPGSKINGATKKIGNNIMLMVNDRRLYSDVFWFTLFHEIGHITNGDYGITFENIKNESEKSADEYAENKLVPPDQYSVFLDKGQFNIRTITEFAENINRDPAIVLGRLLNDKSVEYSKALLSLRHQYKVKAGTA